MNMNNLTATEVSGAYFCTEWETEVVFEVPMMRVVKRTGKARHGVSGDPFDVIDYVTERLLTETDAMGAKSKRWSEVLRVSPT
jgi:hypothetical protein